MAEPVLSEVKDGIGTITFNRPEALNALSTDMTAVSYTHLTLPTN